MKGIKIFRKISFYQIKDLTLNEFRVRYKNAKFGYFWSIIAPLVMLIILYIIFSLIFTLEGPHYQLFLLIGIIYWNFISEATSAAMGSILSKASLFTKTNFPPYAIVVSSIATTFINFLINFAIFFIVAYLLNLKLNLKVLYLPIYFIEIFFLVLGISLFLCALYPKFRDLQYIWNLCLLVGFWISPIIYKETSIPHSFMKYYMLNPLARIINETRDILIFDYMPSLKQQVITIAIIAIIFQIGIFTFMKRSKTFIEDV